MDWSCKIQDWCGLNYPWKNNDSIINEGYKQYLEGLSKITNERDALVINEQYFKSIEFIKQFNLTFLLVSILPNAKCIHLRFKTGLYEFKLETFFDYDINYVGDNDEGDIESIVNIYYRDKEYKNAYFGTIQSIQDIILKTINEKQ
jgi:hypothetical protein